MTDRQREVSKKIYAFSLMVDFDPDVSLAVAAQESSLGENQLSSTKAKGVFQCTTSAMLDLLQAMVAKDDDWIDIVCGILYLRLLLKRWGTIEEALGHYCDPKVREKYVASVLKKIEEAKKVRA